MLRVTILKMEKKSPKRCPRGFRKNKKGICQKVVIQEDDYDERLFNENPFRKAAEREFEDERLFALNPYKDLNRSDLSIKMPQSPKRGDRKSPKSAKPTKNTPTVEKKLPVKRKSPFLLRNLRKAQKKQGKKKVIILEDSDSETLGSESDETSEEDSNLSDFIDNDEEDDDKAWRGDLDEYVNAARQGKLKKTFG